MQVRSKCLFRLQQHYCTSKLVHFPVSSQIGILVACFDQGTSGAHDTEGRDHNPDDMTPKCGKAPFLDHDEFSGGATVESQLGGSEGFNSHVTGLAITAPFRESELLEVKDKDMSFDTMKPVIVIPESLEATNMAEPNAIHHKKMTGAQQMQCISNHPNLEIDVSEGTGISILLKGQAALACRLGRNLVLVCVGINGEEFQNDASILDREASAVTPEPSIVDKVSARRRKKRGEAKFHCV
ncbi:hypothetical protein C3L33_13385, partial [Rhododendron williamsianum]